MVNRIIMSDEVRVKCLNCHWMGFLLDLEVKDEDISDEAIYLACPRCASKDVKPCIDGEIHES